MGDQQYVNPLQIVVQPADKIRGPPLAYKNQTNPRGALFIANWTKYDNDIHQERQGSQCDVQNIKNLFTQVGYNCHTVIEDATKDELLKALQSFKKEEIHKHVDSFIGVFMGHGKENEIATRNGEFIHVADIYDVFDNVNCPSLAGKPKIFVFQHCRGERRTATLASGFEIDNVDGRDVTTSNFQSYGISDTYLFFSTRPRFVSYRSKVTGCIFIEHLCRVLMDWAKDTEIYHLIPMINKSLSNTPCLQKCDFQALDHNCDFYFNPIRAPCNESTSASKEPQHHRLHPSEGATSTFRLETQPSTSQDISGMNDYFNHFDSSLNPYHRSSFHRASSVSKDQLYSDYHRNPTSLLEDLDLPYSSIQDLHIYEPLETLIPRYSIMSNPEDETYRLADNPRGWIYIFNNLDGCNGDVQTLQNKFRELGYVIIIMPKIISFQKMREKINEINIKNQPGNVVVFYFGYGYGEYLYVGLDETESVAYKKFCELFNFKEKNKAKVIFTNICFKGKSSHTVTYRKLQDYVDDTFHLCVKVNGKCSSGSLLTKALIQEFEESGSKQEFARFSRHVTCKIKHLQNDTTDIYITDVRYYEVHRYFYFTNPVEEVRRDNVDKMGPKWNCIKCTFTNQPDILECVMCDCPRSTKDVQPVLPPVDLVSSSDVDNPQPGPSGVQQPALDRLSSSSSEFE